MHFCILILISLEFVYDSLIDSKLTLGQQWLGIKQGNNYPVLETKAGPSVRDWQLLVRTSNFLHISLQNDVWISQNSDQDRQLFQLSPEHCNYHNG